MAKGNRPKKHNVNATTKSHSVKAMRVYKRNYRERQKAKKDNKDGWDTGWDF